MPAERIMPAEVACGGCTLCCRSGELILVTVEDGDYPYDTQAVDIGNGQYLAAVPIPVGRPRRRVTLHRAARRQPYPVDRKPGRDASPAIHGVHRGAMTALQERVVNGNPRAAAQRRIDTTLSVHSPRSRLSLDTVEFLS